MTPRALTIHRASRAAIAGGVALAVTAVTGGSAPVAPASAAAPTPPPAGAAISDSHFTLLDFDSQSAPYPAPPSLDGTAAGALDGDDTTQWASDYNGGDPLPMPHFL